ncbi:MAG: hypothetical protein K6F94_02740 [Bacteroidaceae bacterium]|nr:hypothetical protein [Bacteroidaceae bacterium]
MLTAGLHTFAQQPSLPTAELPSAAIRVAGADSLQNALPDSAAIAKAADIAAPAPAILGGKTDSLLINHADTLLQEAMHAYGHHFTPNPIRALWLSLVLPGAGQIYNRKFWKLPIFYGGFLGCAYALQWNNQMLRDYSQAYLDIMDSDPNTKSYEKMLPMGYDISGREEQFQTIFKNKKNFYRRYRDMSIFAFAAVYALAVIDAYVDAELSTFDITPDLSLRVTPAVIGPSTGQRHFTQGFRCADNGLGMACRLEF